MLKSVLLPSALQLVRFLSDPSSPRHSALLLGSATACASIIQRDDWQVDDLFWQIVLLASGHHSFEAGAICSC
jgi:hypothetical protein